MRARAWHGKTVGGALGRRHHVVSCSVVVIQGRVPHGDKGGPVSNKDKRRAANQAQELFVLTNAGGNGVGVGECECGCT